ncbi:WD40 repeat-like protein [Trametes maxima]|nr:WD40 repeat-like protein [Trametes maxima]
MVDPLQITADEINCLIYAYFKDSGFSHSAFVLRAESHLDHSPHFRKHVPRGELVELLSKALLFSEVEAHWKGDSMTLSCRNSFNILEPHVCSAAPPPQSRLEQRQHALATHVDPGQKASSSVHSRATSDNSMKRKASGTPASDEAPKEKRAKTNSPVEVEVEVGLGSSLEPKRATVHLPPTDEDGTSSVAGPSIDPKDVPLPSEGLGKEQEDGSVQMLKAHQAEVFVCAWNPMNKAILASGSRDSVVHIWNVPGPNRDGDVPLHIDPPLTCAYPPKDDQGDLTCLDWSPDGALLAIGCYDAVLRICNESGKVYFTHTQHDKGPIFSVRFSPSGRWLVTASLDGSACVWDVQGKRLHRHYAAHRECCLDVDWLSESEFATSGSDGLVHIMNVDNPKPLKTLRGHKSEVNELRCNPGRTRLASCSDDKTARVWNVEDIVYGRPADDRVLVLNGHKGQVNNLAWIPGIPAGEHELLVTASFDCTSRLWDSVTGQCLRVFEDHKTHVYNLAVSPDGQHFATAGGDGWLFVYDVRVCTLSCRWSYNTGKRGIFEICWQKSSNLDRIAIAMENHAVGVIDLTRIPELQ